MARNYKPPKRKKLIVKQTKRDDRRGDYVVDRLINLIHPKIGEFLREEELQAFIDNPDINVEVAPNRDTGRRR